MRIASHELVKGSAIISIGTVLGGALSYLFSILMGRMLGPGSFGDLGAITSFLMLFASFGSGVLTVSMFYTSSAESQGNERIITKIHSRFSKYLLITGGALATIGVIFREQIAETLSISDPNALGMSMFYLLFSLLIVVNRGILQGKKRFYTLTLSTIAELAIKLIIAYCLVLLGWGLFGAIVALVFSIIISYIYTWWLIRDVLASNDSKQQAETNQTLKKDIIRYASPAFFGSLFTLLIMNIDIIIVKYYFEPVLAGKYIAISIIAKIIYYITSPISTVMFPLITEQVSKGSKHYKTLFQATLLTLMFSLLFFLVFYLFQNNIITFFYGNGFAGLEFLLPKVSILVICLSLINLMSAYFMSIKQFTFLYMYSITLVFQVVYIRNNNDSIMEVLNGLQIGSALLLFSMLSYYVYSKRRQLATKVISLHGQYR